MMNGGASPQHRMVFIVGRGRSGTTLLRSVLNSHPRISVAPEALFILYLLRGFREGPWTGRRVRRFAEQLFLERRMRRWRLDRAELTERLASIDEPSFSRLSAEVYEAYADAAGKTPGRLLGDKNPLFALFTDELAEIFPDARFVHIVRDYRDNVLSYQNVPFDLSSPPGLAYRWREYNVSILRTARRLPDRFHRLRFEDLIAEPRPALDRLFAFLGLPSEEWEPRKDETSPDVAWHRNLDRPIDAGVAQQWERSMPAKTVQLLDRICQPVGKELGYAPAGVDGPAESGRAGMAVGWAMTRLERLLFHFPVRLQAAVVDSYRRLTGNVIR